MNHPSRQGHPDVDWDRYEAELADVRITGRDLAACVVLAAICTVPWLPVIALVWLVKR